MSNLKDILHSFKTKDELCPDIWEKEDKKYKMIPKVRERLLEIANEFFEFLKVDVVLSDITLTGSLSNFNWSNFSDVDLHLIVDFKQFNEENIPLYEEFFLLKKTIFNDKHDIKILGYDVELYVQDEGEEHTSTGVYSIMNDEWITEPKKEDKEINYEYVKKKSEKWMKTIDSVLNEVDDEPLENAKNILKQLKDKIKKYRQCGLEKGGEYSIENLVFKVLRRNGYIEKLFDKNNKLIDKKLTMNEQEENLTDSQKAQDIKPNLRSFYDILESIDTDIFQETDGSYTAKKTVEAVQIALDLLGYDLSYHEFDGKFGQETADAVDDFKFDNGIIDEKPESINPSGINEDYTPKGAQLASPIPYMKVTHPFKERRSYESHPGVDIPIPLRTEIKSPADGVVDDAEIRNNACGGTLKIEHENGFTTRYCHCKKIFVVKGDFVKRGQVVALTGGDRGGYGSGNSSGAHLHFEVKKNGVLVNPVDYVDTTGESYYYAPESDDTNDIDDSSKSDEKIKYIGQSFISPKMVEFILEKLYEMGITDEDLEKYTITKIDFSDKVITNDLDFYKSILTSIGAEPTSSNLKFLMAWRKAEGGKAKNNPFNTSYNLTNDTGMCLYNCITGDGKGTKPIDCKTCPTGTKPCVKHYSTREFGLEATVLTLKLSIYSCIVNGLRENKDPKEIANCSCLNTWGTRDGIKNVLSSGNVTPPEISS